MRVKYLLVFPLVLLVLFAVYGENTTPEKPPAGAGTVNVEIHHCMTCGFTSRANALAEEINRELGIKAVLIVGKIGSFDVFVNGDLVFSKADAHRFPEQGEIIRKIEEYENIWTEFPSRQE